jgi:ribosomal protein L40E
MAGKEPAGKTFCSVCGVRIPTHMLICRHCLKEQLKW